MNARFSTFLTLLWRWWLWIGIYFGRNEIQKVCFIEKTAQQKEVIIIIIIMIVIFSSLDLYKHLKMTNSLQSIIIIIIRGFIFNSFNNIHKKYNLKNPLLLAFSPLFRSVFVSFLFNKLHIKEFRLFLSRYLFINHINETQTFHKRPKNLSLFRLFFGLI